MLTDGSDSLEVERLSEHYGSKFLKESRVPQILGGVIAVQVLGCLFFFARVYSRAFLIRTWKSEDWTLLASWLLATGYSICQYGQVKHGAGRHLAATPNIQDAITSQKYAYAAQCFIILGIPMPKLSMCLCYLRIFHHDVVGRRLIWGLLIMLVLVMVAFIVENFFTCQPLSLYWNELRPTDRCLLDSSVFYTEGSINLAIDMALMAIVLPRIIMLQMNKRQKSVLIGIVCLGALSVVAGFIRIIHVGTVLSKAKSSVGRFDPPWDLYDVAVWTSTEIYVALICAAAPGVKPLVSKLLPRLLGSSNRSRMASTNARSKQHKINSGMEQSTPRTGVSSLLNNKNTTDFATRPGPRAEIYSTGKRGEDSISGKSNPKDQSSLVQAGDGILRNTSLSVGSERHVSV